MLVGGEGGGGAFCRIFHDMSNGISRCFGLSSRRFGIGIFACGNLALAIFHVAQLLATYVRLRLTIDDFLCIFDSFSALYLLN